MSGCVTADGSARRRFFLSLLAVVLPLTLLGYRGVIDSGDGMQRYQGAVALLRGAGYTISADAGARRPLKYGPAQSALALPLIIQARILAPLLLRATTFPPDWYESLYENITQGGFMLLTPLVTAATALLLASTLQLLGAAPPRAWWLVLLWLCATPALVYANLAFDEPLQALLLLAGAHAALRGRGATSALWFGLALFTRLSALVFLPVGFILLDRAWLALTPARRRFIVAAAGMLVGQMAYLRVQFGAWLTTGYGGEGFTTPPGEGLHGLLLAPGKSIFLFAPPLLLAVALLPRVWRTRREMAAAVLYALVVFLLLFAAWWDWSGDTCWGPRFVVALLPFLLLPLAVAPVPARWLIGLGLAGLLVNMPALLVPYQDLWQQVVADSGQDGVMALHSWRYVSKPVAAAMLTLIGRGAAADTLLLARHWWGVIPVLPFITLFSLLAIVGGWGHRPRCPAAVTDPGQ